MASFIKAISYILPDTIVTNQDLVEEFPEWSVDKIAKKVGVVSRHVVAEGPCASDLAEQAARKLFLENDRLLFCTAS